jgi:small-conductance mechanosensitive channel
MKPVPVPVPNALQAYSFVTLAIKIGLILIGAIIVIRVCSIIVSRMEAGVLRRHPSDEDASHQRRARTLGGVLRRVSRAIIIVVALMMAVRELGFDMTPALAAAGGFGVAAGLGAQSLIRDWLVGFFIIYENEYAVGDAVQIAGVSGTVEALSLRHTEVRDGEGALHYVPNGEIKVVTNLTKSWATPVIKIPVSLTEDPVRVQQVLERFAAEAAADPELKALLREPPKVLGMEEVANGLYSMAIQANTYPQHRVTVARALRQGAIARLRAEGIATHAPVPGATAPVETRT